MSDWDDFCRFAVSDAERGDEMRAALAHLPYPPNPARASVLVGLWRDDGGAAQIVLTRRSDALPQHAGQISFPGGKIDALDADEIAAALRETHEEIGVAAQHIEVFGMLPALPTLTGFDIFPVLAEIKTQQWQRNPAEVAEIFTVPATLALDVAQYQPRTHRNTGLITPQLPYHDYDIWGATAAILYRLAVSFERFSIR